MSDEIATTSGDIIGGRTFWYDRQGNPLTVEQAEPLLTDDEYKIVARTQMKSIEDGSDLLVSTVWLGVNHNFSRVGPPLIFETMIFGQIGTDVNEMCWRYATEAEAKEGHAAVVEALETGKAKPLFHMPGIELRRTLDRIVEPAPDRKEITP